MQIDHAKFFTGYREAYGKLSQATVNGLELLGRNMQDDPDLTNLQWAAYMLATVKHECADKWMPITEFGNKEYFNKYNAGTAIGKRLGNTQVGDGYRYRGRGYVQITGRANYARLTKALGLGPDQDLVADPDQTLRPVIAYRIMSLGMRTGLFTGKKLSDYINAQGCDYRNARRIINGTDQAAKIAAYAKTLEGIIRGAVIS
ncbi:MAG: hypothetical protein HOP18_05215 [Deltaproteobacteria bacterium]|nr:hypothetical protein [Deltaproteobacteria bacterium]